MDEDQEKSEKKPEEDTTSEKKEEPEKDITTVEESKSVDVKQAKKTKKPSYEESDNVLEFSLGGEEGGNIGEMMKMLGPMLKGLTSEFNVFGTPPNPNNDESKPKEQETKEQETEKQETTEQETKKQRSLIDLMTSALDGSNDITDCDDEE